MESSVRITRSFINRIYGFIDKTLVMADLEARKIRHDPTELIVRVLQPVLWLLVFGEVFTKIRAIPTPGDIPYIDFMAPGVLAQSALFVAIFSGMGIIWERDLGIVHKFLASPAPRSALALGKSLAGAVRALSQAVVIYLLALILGVNLNGNPLCILGVFFIVIIGAICFSSFSLIIALWVRTRERFMGAGQLLTMPFFFASNAIYPLSVMPTWLRIIARGNPLTYEVDALRTLMLSNFTSANGLWLDFVVLIGATIVLNTIAAILYPRAAT
ncbi:MAG: ABC transporter permease [Chloroflexi bacterium]|nr:ABC transporter permease [Chloroflexota bacterium]